MSVGTGGSEGLVVAQVGFDGEVAIVTATDDFTVPGAATDEMMALAPLLGD